MNVKLFSKTGVTNCFCFFKILINSSLNLEDYSENEKSDLPMTTINRTESYLFGE